VLESEKRQMEKTWLEQPRLCSAWVHQTVRWCTGQCPVRQAGSGQLAALGSQRRVGRANGRQRNLCVTRGRANGLMGALDCPMCTGRLQIVNGRLRQNRKEISTGQCLVVHRNVRCTSRQKARIAFLDCSQRLLATLGL
jgi:hypothetical protein